VTDTKQGLIFAALAILGGAAGGVIATQGLALFGKSDDRVREAILADPEMIAEASELLRANDTTKLVEQYRQQIETPYAGAWEGAENADVTLVQFFDYGCGYCRGALPDIERLLKDDPKLRVVYREFPILGPGSESAARTSLAAAKAGKYAEFHRAVYAAGPPDPATVAQIADRLGVARTAATDPAIQTELEANFTLTSALGLRATPAWVVGNQILSGAVGYDALKAAVAKARALK
jgi:thiol-disulfide isomerase/thioredoxin